MKSNEVQQPREIDLFRLVSALCITFLIGVTVTVALYPAIAEMFTRTEQTEVVRVVKPSPAMRELSVNKEIEADAEAEDKHTMNPRDVELIGRTIWGEAGGVQSEAERAAVAWCILNRVDAYGKSIEEVVTAPKQFHGYRPKGDCPQEHLELAADVLARWYAEKNGATEVGRTLPADYLYFVGDGERNHFSVEYESTDFWTWSLANPYK